jgi:dCMP deaminase
MLSDDQARAYLRLAYVYAKMLSTDPSTQNAAILLPVGTAVQEIFAANHFPAGVMETETRWERPLKYSFVEHAERNVIYAAAASGVPTRGATMICPWFACADCGRAIIQAGIVEVIGHKLPDMHNDQKWYDSIKLALEMFDEAGVKCRWVEGTIGVDGLRFDGRIVSR